MGDFPDYKKGADKRRLSVVLSEEELTRLFLEMEGKYRLMARLQYGAGLRVNERVRLRVKDIDFDNRQVHVRGGKGDKDRATLLPQSLVPMLKDQLAVARKCFDRPG